MKLIYLFLMILFPLIGYCQQIELVTPLHDLIKESSGLIYIDQKLITHNDSGGKPILYEIDISSGNIIREVVVNNVANIDWEDICYDNSYIYVADFGNNAGNRANLKIYRISISNYNSSTNDTVNADSILFNYSDQIDFTPSQYSTNYDAEALISYNDSLYIFTKNWKNNWTNIYALSKNPGTYQISKLDSINSQGLVSGATFNTISNTILLSGYTLTSAFIIEISGFIDTKFSSGIIVRSLLNLPSGFSYQIESITGIGENQYYLSAEENSIGSSGLYKLNFEHITNVRSIEDKTNGIFPNPTSGSINITCNDYSAIYIYDLQGRLIKSSSNRQISLSNLLCGTYIALINNTKGETYFSKKLIITK